MNISITLKRLAVTMGVGALVGFGSVANADTLRDILDVQEQANKYAQQTQQQIDEISDETREIVAEYRQLLRQIESLQIYNAQLQRLIDGQEREMATLNEDISRVTQINREITPLMLEMLSALEQFVALDVPFLAKERGERLERLSETVDRSDVSTSEKFRRVLEAYQIENEYGRTVNAYKGTVNREGQTLSVDFLQIGRIAFAYLKADGSEAGLWNQKNREWETLPDSYIAQVREGIRMARQQTTPNLITLPVSAPEKVQ